MIGKKKRDIKGRRNLRNRKVKEKKKGKGVQYTVTMCKERRL